MREFPAGPVIKNPPSSAGDMGLIAGQRTKTAHSVGQRSPGTATGEATAQRGKVHVLQRRASALQQRPSPAKTKDTYI